MKSKGTKIPVLILVLGLIAVVAAFLLTSMLKVPVVTEHDFNYSITYRLNGEEKTVEGVYRCSFNGHNEIDPTERSYTGTFLTIPYCYTIAQQDGIELYIVVRFNDCYLMSDTKNDDYEPYLEDPYLEAVDAEGVEYDYSEMPGVEDVEIVSWEYPEPIENTFVFSSFSILNIDSMLAMLLVGFLVIAASMIYVKKDRNGPAKASEKDAAVLTWVIILAAIPLLTILICLLQLTTSIGEPIYQVFLCLPAFTAFTVAASIILRHKGFKKTGMLIQFIGPALFALYLLGESIVNNLFL